MRSDWIFFLFVLFGFPLAVTARPVEYRMLKVVGVEAHIVLADLASSRVKIQLYVASGHAGKGIYPHESFEEMINKTLPTAAMSGTYYDTRTFHPIGTLVSGGRILHIGLKGVAFCIDDQNRVSLHVTHNLRSSKWRRFKIILSAGPTLVANGQVSVTPRLQHFHDPDILRPASRTAIGMTQKDKLLFVAVSLPISLDEMAQVMKKLGAVDAATLDGGSATALYYRGRYLVRPRRQMTNILLLYENH